VTKPVKNKSPEARRRAGQRVRKRQVQEARVSLSDIRRLRYFGQVSDSLKPLASQVERELGRLLADKGDAITEAERTIIEDVARLGLLMRAEFAVYLRTGEREAAASVRALAGERRAGLKAVGLERRVKEIDLHAYLGAKGGEE